MKLPVVETGPQVVKKITFGVFSQQDIKKMSVLELHQRDLLDITKLERTPAIGGALDRKMGTPDKSQHCETCGENIQDCVGHFGVIRFVLPVFHIGFYKLMITTCSQVLVDEKTKRSYLKRLRIPSLDGIGKKNILKSLNSLCKKNTSCPHCGALNGMVKKVGPLKIIHEKYKKKKSDEEQEFRESFETAAEMDPWLKPHIGKAQHDLNPLVVQALLEKVSDEDCELMGLDPANSRPELFLWNAFPVPPVCIRPSIGQENASTEDDLTILASEIIDINAKMKACMEDGTQTSLLMEFWDFLQLQCAMYITSDLPGIPSHLQGNLNKIKKGFCQRLKGKQGRFRGNLSGKRVDFSGRTVISPDPNLRIDQVAVPLRVCKILTYPEKVTKHNIEKLRQNVLHGPDVHPGATYVTSGKTGIKKFLKYGKADVNASNLEIGDTVDRHLQDGDVVLFNRQPSLHKLSIMSHYVKVRPWRTFRFNECVCAPYNADFDGDEMNLHVPQTEEARAEAVELMGVKNNLVTPRNGEPLIAATQDFITASYLLSRKDIFYDRAQFVQICSYLSDALASVDIPPPAIVKPIQLWTGKQIFNVLLKPNKDSPVNVNLETKCRNFGKDEKNIKTGIPFSSAKTSTGNPIDSSFCPNDNWLVIHNSELMCGVIDKAIIGDGSKKSMFYVILRDYGPVKAAEAMNMIAKLSARWLANQGFSIGIDDVQPGEKLRSEKMKTVEKGYRDCDETILMSKEGRLPNQAGCDEEQTLEAKLSGILSKIRDDVGTVCFAELNKYNAPLTMSLCGSKGSKINVSQMVACVGQQIISGSRIPNGFGDRSLPHFPKNAKTPAAKGFVGNSFFTGLTPTEFLFHAVSGREGLVDTAVKTAETGYMSRRLMKALEDLACHYDLSVRDSTGGMVQFKYGDDGLDPARIEGEHQPVEFYRSLRHIIATNPQQTNSKFLSKEEINTALEKALNQPQIRLSCSKEYVNAVRKFVKEEILWRADAAKHSKITKNQVDRFLEQCCAKYIKSMIEPGTAVGAIGAQSIGEPGTQMTLKTFHFAGVASMNITLGVPRIKEIINASKVISTPIMTAPLNHKVGNYSEDSKISQSRYGAEMATRVVKGRIEKTVLGEIMEYMQEVIMDNDLCLRIKIDLEAVKKLQLELDIESVKWALIRAPKLKISDDLVKIESQTTLRLSVPRSKTDTSNTFVSLQNLKRVLPRTVVSGLATTSRAVINDVSSENRLELMIEGYGLKEVMGTEGVDGVKCKSNHVLEMLETLGIEAARETICREILETMRSHGMTIDRRHVMLLADLMSFKGEILGITRFGIAKMKDSVLMLASFEKTTDHLFEASFFGKHDKIQGVSECIIMGVPMQIGTGMFKLLQSETNVTFKKQRKLIFDSPVLHPVKKV